MAIDTAAKRGSAINPGSPWRSHLPFPDGTIGQGDRQAVAFWYSGILADAVSSTSIYGPARVMSAAVSVAGSRAASVVVAGARVGGVQ